MSHHTPLISVHSRNHNEILTLTNQHGLDTYYHFLHRLIQSTASAQSVSSLPFRLLTVELARLTADPLLIHRLRDTIEIPISAPHSGKEGPASEIFRLFDLSTFLTRTNTTDTGRIVAAASFRSASRKELRAQAAQVLRLEIEPTFTRLHSAALAQTSSNSTSSNESSQSLNTVLKWKAEQITAFLQALFSTPDAAPASTDSPSASLLPASVRVLILSTFLQTHPNIAIPAIQALVDGLSTNDISLLSPTLLTDMAQIQDLARSEALLKTLLKVNQLGKIEGQEKKLASLLSSVEVDVDLRPVIRTLSGFLSPQYFSALIRSCDIPQEAVDDLPVGMIASVIQVVPSSVEGLLGTWLNQRVQLDLIGSLLTLPPDSFSFGALYSSCKPVVSVESVAAASNTVKAMAAAIQNSQWNCLDLMVIILDNYHTQMRAVELFQICQRKSPEVALIGSLAAKDGFNNVHPDLQPAITHSLDEFFYGHPSDQLVFLRLWQIDSLYIKKKFQEYWALDNTNVTRILDLAHDLKVRFQHSTAIYNADPIHVDSRCASCNPAIRFRSRYGIPGISPRVPEP